MKNNYNNSESSLKNFLEIPYDKLEEMNLKAKEKRDSVDPKDQEVEYRKYLESEKRIKAITLCFSDIEGKLHMLDYDKKFLLASAANLTFDGSSIRGFTVQSESDLRLDIDWTSFMWLPADLFGPGKVIMFANILNRDRSLYESDLRGQLQDFTRQLKREEKIEAYVSAEIEGFLMDGVNAEQNYEEEDFKLISTGGYFHSLPLDKLRQFIDACAEAQRAMGYKNEKDHPEVAPSQFELNFSYTQALRACDQIQLYKLVCRQVATSMGMTATFLPKPVIGINGSGMHTNFSLFKGGKNLFYDKKGKDSLSALGWDYVSKLLNHAPELSLIFSSSVNAYRRLDPHFEAPNQIKASAIDRGAMVRLPVGNDKTTRLEIRAVAPDANPYLVIFAILKIGLNGKRLPVNSNRRERLRFLPGNINDAIRLFRSSTFTGKILGEENKEKYLSFKSAVADRSPRELGKSIKVSEVIYHHEVTNQVLWNSF
ncbi:glutamine synthetase [Candidatus Curtissbacteria bacterium RIFOXYB1_FULL_41_59]|uniref:Glutamine synthetase n=1 Tax=Candidatus Curtissbacteria bacterium RIFOXYA1_FULL_41_14 TaxID=1797737 RepID=A0A1F5HGR0_9BACT|nr:MAG: Glutamine synthetase [Candidatus Curtissbacteria bacterium GW2011_GWB1_40_28]KKR60589.1 MAG: Glutamine synthetase [Microgenomates group bacterium GW2011_GWC1_40_35]KKR75250.1 MAG: Glutamine synthetase [Candidatus Curtissbacteria bacterium GW2011_GWD1_40_8]KKS00257.1 MAG: Glutamine synthetase [Candidatus Curtissbacteria bacterium GW2011_GWC2_41_21]OGD78346.1 MAG: glutamine synthetase [Candidatus Curtissbacteria bacterium RIFCSPHIGHO2_01_FULL_34_40]OGD92318.1 MAG: glutamine synthetase [C